MIDVSFELYCSFERTYIASSNEHIFSKTKIPWMHRDVAKLLSKFEAERVNL